MPDNPLAGKPAYDLVPTTVINHRSSIVEDLGRKSTSFPLGPFGTPFEGGFTLDWLLDRIQRDLPSDYAENVLYYDGDHWQSGMGWSGPIPMKNDPTYLDIKKKIEAAFVSKNVIKEVVKRHRDGVVGREPSWSLTSRAPIVLPPPIPPTMPVPAPDPALPPPAPTPAPANPDGTPKPLLPPAQAPPTANVDPNAAALAVAQIAQEQQDRKLIAEAEALLTEWWDSHNCHTHFKDAVVSALLSGRASLRLYLPPGFVDSEAGTVPIANGDLETALAYLHSQHPLPDQATIVVDKDTMQKVGVYSFLDEANERHGEVVYLQGFGKDAITVLQEVETSTGEPSNNADNALTFVTEVQMELGGRLLMYEIHVPKMITDQVRQMQRMVNKALTMANNNSDLAGFLERTILNGQLPGHYEDIPEQAGKQRFVRDDYNVGGGAVNYIAGVPMYDQNNKYIGIATPSIVYRDPVSPETFEETKLMGYAGILEETQQSHYLLASEQYASGESRKQARADFESSLRDTRGEVNQMGRWYIETALAFAEWLAGVPGKYTSKLRCVFDCRVDPGPATTDGIRSAIELNAAEGLSNETMMIWSGVDDPDAERRKIDLEKAKGIVAPKAVITGAQANGTGAQQTGNLAPTNNKGAGSKNQQKNGAKPNVATGANNN
jgi:hypothetical protein